MSAIEALVNGGGVKSPYLLPEGNVQIAFSGGRTSAYMLHHILEANGCLPDRARVVFANTGREMPETLDFVQEVGSRWGVPITWVEYRPDGAMFEVVSHNLASRNGEPFEAMCIKRHGVPNQFVRFCTIELKISTAKRYLMTLGWSEWTAATGIRADEPKRFVSPTDKRKDRWFVWQPLVAAGVTKRDVTEFWAHQPFDLQLPNVNGRTQLGNCDGCFLKSEAARAALARDFPDRFDWWVRLEEKMSRVRTDLGKSGPATFIAHQSYKQTAEFVRRQGDWLFSTEGALCQADEGECIA